MGPSDYRRKVGTGYAVARGSDHPPTCSSRRNQADMTLARESGQAQLSDAGCSGLDGDDGLGGVPARRRRVHRVPRRSRRPDAAVSTRTNWSRSNSTATGSRYSSPAVRDRHGGVRRRSRGGRAVVGADTRPTEQRVGVGRDADVGRGRGCDHCPRLVAEPTTYRANGRTVGEARAAPSRRGCSYARSPTISPLISEPSARSSRHGYHKSSGSCTAEESRRPNRPTVVADYDHLRVHPVWIENQVRAREKTLGRNAHRALTALPAYLGIVRTHTGRGSLPR